MRRKARRIPGKRRKKKGQSIVDPDRGVPMSTGVNSSE
jgi:hypothetical protein